MLVSHIYLQVTSLTLFYPPFRIHGFTIIYNFIFVIFRIAFRTPDTFFDSYPCPTSHFEAETILFMIIKTQIHAGTDRSAVVSFVKNAGCKAFLVKTGKWRTFNKMLFTHQSVPFDTKYQRNHHKHRENDNRQKQPMRYKCRKPEITTPLYIHRHKR